MTDTQPGTESNDTNWNRQASTFDWEGWIAEENAADVERAKAKAAQEAEAAELEAAKQPIRSGALNFPPPTGQPLAPPAGQPALNYPPPVGLTQSFTPVPPVNAAFGYRSPDGHPMPMGYAQPGVSYSGFQGVPTSRPRDTVSILALIFGILPFIPLGFVLGIIGIVRTANPIRKGRWMAVTGLVLALAWAGLAVGLNTIWKATPSAVLSTNSSTTPVTKPTTATPTSLRAGDCYQDTVLGNVRSSGADHVSSIKIIPCAQPHNAVVYATTVLPAGAWTSTADKLTIANKQCLPLAKKYFNGTVLDQDLRFGAFAPSQIRWGLGFRTGQCIAVDPDKNFKGDIRQDR